MDTRGHADRQGSTYLIAKLLTENTAFVEHTAPVTSVAARRMAGGEVWVASTGNDSTVVVTRWVVRVVVMVMIIT